eukprot:scaffold11664_cov55-Attheya_sp.AAC.2
MSYSVTLSTVNVLWRASVIRPVLERACLSNRPSAVRIFCVRLLGHFFKNDSRMTPTYQCIQFRTRMHGGISTVGILVPTGEYDQGTTGPNATAFIAIAVVACMSTFLIARALLIHN